MLAPDVTKLDPEQLRQYGGLELLARQVVEGFIVGLHKSPFHGFSVEFAEHRLYNQGEATRHIDWKLYGRTDRLYIKRYEEETNLRCQLVIDTSGSMYYPLKQFNKLQFSVYATAAIAYMLKGQRDAAGLATYSDRINQFLPARSSGVHQKQMNATLEQLLVSTPTGTPTSTASALHEIAERMHKRSMIVIFSDMFQAGNETEELFEALQHLKFNKHEVMLFHTVDEIEELNFSFDNRPHKFVDLETGTSIKLNPNEIKDSYIDQTLLWRDAIKNRCIQYKIDFIEADIRKGFNQVLLPYLIKRKKMR
ncbi:MAG: DUF58 domain-containing protein [Bacteroidota bacterium]|nr:DUF58 domain-containing protein [Bacteroidota bacterium]